jgi:hypothetical protein
VTTPGTNGPDEPTRQLSVSTAPPPAPRRWWSAVPRHLGRARTSTVVLALLFVGLYTLYLNVRPPDPAVGTVPATESTVQTPATTAPAEPSESAEPTTTAPTTPVTPTPSPTTAPPEGTGGEETPAESPELTPTTAEEEPTSAAPTATGAPGT